MKKILYLIGVFILALTMTGCSKRSGAEEQKNDPTQKAEQENTAVSGKDEASQFVAEITADKASYAAGETVNYKITVHNNRSHWYTTRTDLEYTCSDELVAVSADSMPTTIPKLETGQYALIEGSVIWNDNAPAASGTGATKKNAKSSGGEEVILRPYVKINYAGQEALLRVVINLQAYQEKVTIDNSKKDIGKAITCHDPSIFKDFDGKYYLLGTHITGGYSSDLRNWTSVDKDFRATFTAETKDKIREWNKDSGEWYGYLWAPDVVYNPELKKYCYYLSANGDDWKSNIVMLTSDSILGPYEYAGSVVYGGFTEEDFKQTDLDEVLGCENLPDRYIKNGIANRKWGDKWPNCIDPCVFYDDDGKLWMSYGSWSGGIFMLELDGKTGLRDYTVKYPENAYSDPYFGTKIAGGWYVSGEGSYIQKIGKYYWLFMSYGNLEARGGYNIRVFRSERPNGGYEDMLGNSALYDKYIFNYNESRGVRLFGGYKWRTMTGGQVAQGHNSAFIDDDGRAYIVYHSRTTDGSEGHTVKVHQLFLNEDEWLVAAPYYTSGETLDAADAEPAKVAGEYEIIIHNLDIDYKNLGLNQVYFINLNADGTITGEYEGKWEVVPGTSNINLTFNGDTYKGVVLKERIENTVIETEVFTAVGEHTQITVWGSKVTE